MNQYCCQNDSKFAAQTKNKKLEVKRQENTSWETARLELEGFRKPLLLGTTGKRPRPHRFILGKTNKKKYVVKGTVEPERMTTRRPHGDIPSPEQTKKLTRKIQEPVLYKVYSCP